MTRALLILICLAVTSAHARAEGLFEPKSTWAVVAGVLSWQDSRLSSFSKDERKDQELFDTLARRGVPASQRTLLLDDEATSRGILRAVGAAIAEAPAGSTLLFYYAGHGVKADDGRIVFASWDVDLGDVAASGLVLDELARLLAGFKGKRLILLADCCYSGGLARVAATLAERGIEVMALTSAEASNLSTVNWTFTQAIIDGLGGRALSDRDDDGTLTVGELAAEVRDGMRHREGQRYGWLSRGVPADAEVARTVADQQTLGRGHGDYQRRGWVRTRPGGRVARIIGTNHHLRARVARLYVELYDYATRTETWVDEAAVEPVSFKTWPAGAAIKVLWGGTVWDAEVREVDDGFMRITYPGWDARWDEWITAARVVEQPKEGARRARVEWKGHWYDAVVKSQRGGRWCISYVGYGPEWDECVGAERIRLEP